MFHYVYILQSLKTSELYVGFTINVEKRLQEHNRGDNLSTKTYRPWELIHFEAYKNKKDAQRREKYLKTSQGRKMLKFMLKEYFTDKRSRVSQPGLSGSEIRPAALAANGQV